MKKVYSFMVAAVAMFAAVSCNQELEQENLPTGETVVYTASADGADVKATLNEETRKSEWVEGDAITVLDANKGWTFTTAQSGANVDFSNSEGFGEYRPVLAVYPAGEYTADVAAKTVKAHIGTWQQAQAGTYHNTAALAVAYSESNSFAFKNAHALLKFTVNADNVTHVVFCGNKEEAITGNVDVTLGKDGVEKVECLDTEFTTGDGEDKKVEMKKGTWVECYAYHDDANKYFVKGQTYYIAVAPQVFAEGVSVKVRINEGAEIVAKSTDKKVETKVNTILDLGEIEYAAVEPEVEEFEAWNGYIYLQPNAKWNEADARFAAYFFNDDVNTWENLTLVEGTQNIYGCEVPEGYTNVIFCRMNPAASGNNWDNKWGQTSDLKVADGNLYVIATDSWDSGSWKTVEAVEPPVEPEPEPEPDPTPDPEQPVTPGLTSEWALLGAFSSWADQPMLTTEDADVVVLKNVSMKAAEGFIVRKPATDWADKHGAGDVNYLKTNHYITTNKDGADMCLEADGTYDIYFNTSTKNIYVMAAGKDYTTATKQTVSGEEPKQEEPEVTENKLYLKPNANWKKDGARFAAYFFGGAPGEVWVSMTDSDKDGIYELNIPQGYDYGCKVIFCRMNGGTTSNNWNNKWNQTSNLDTPTDGKNLYTVMDGTWDKGGGTWSVK